MRALFRAQLGHIKSSHMVVLLWVLNTQALQCLIWVSMPALWRWLSLSTSLASLSSSCYSLLSLATLSLSWSNFVYVWANTLRGFVSLELVQGVKRKWEVWRHRWVLARSRSLDILEWVCQIWHWLGFMTQIAPPAPIMKRKGKQPVKLFRWLPQSSGRGEIDHQVTGKTSVKVEKAVSLHCENLPRKEEIWGNLMCLPFKTPS